jgi:hydrogenase maturation protease
MLQPDTDATVLILGIGNTLRSDDGIGVCVMEALCRCDDNRLRRRGARFCDGGTLGLSLLPTLETANDVIVIDAADIGVEPGTVRSFEGEAMDAQLGGKKQTSHEVALADLMAAARLLGQQPARRALVAIQPGSTDWGAEPSAVVAAAIPEACRAVFSLLDRWNHDR